MRFLTTRNILKTIYALYFGITFPTLFVAWSFDTFYEYLKIEGNNFCYVDCSLLLAEM